MFKRLDFVPPALKLPGSCSAAAAAEGAATALGLSTTPEQEEAVLGGSCSQDSCATAFDEAQPHARLLHKQFWSCNSLLQRPL